MNKAAGPDNIPGHVQKTCIDQLVDVITDIINISLSQESVPNCFKTATIISVPKKSTSVLSLNDYRPVALTLILMKCFEKLVLKHKATSQTAWTLTSLHTEPTDPQRMPSPLSSTQF